MVRRHELIRGIEWLADADGFEPLTYTERAMLKSCANELAAALTAETTETP